LSSRATFGFSKMALLHVVTPLVWATMKNYTSISCYTCFFLEMKAIIIVKEWRHLLSCKFLHPKRVRYFWLDRNNFSHWLTAEFYGGGCLYSRSLLFSLSLSLSLSLVLPLHPSLSYSSVTGDLVDLCESLSPGVSGWMCVCVLCVFSRRTLCNC
jgi:hypothetical protein